MRPNDTPTTAARRRLPLTALGLVLFGGAALVTTEFADAYRIAHVVKSRTIITIDAPGLLALRERSPADLSRQGPAYGCKRVLAFGEIEIGQACLPRGVAVAVAH